MSCNSANAKRDNAVSKHYIIATAFQLHALQNRARRHLAPLTSIMHVPLMCSLTAVASERATLSLPTYGLGN